jgi:hypothetical protein
VVYPVTRSGRKLRAGIYDGITKARHGLPPIDFTDEQTAHAADTEAESGRPAEWSKDVISENA